ncbi:hypothetical protein CDB3_21865 [Bacillus sp. CDB3]|nr:hypothetical protein CDB3_21865 [Bacillus sp. CDB3]
MAVDIKKCTWKNLRRLQRIMYETFYETFKHQNSLTQMNAHLDKTCNLQQLGKEVSNDRFWCKNFKITESHLINLEILKELL